MVFSMVIGCYLSSSGDLFVVIVYQGIFGLIPPISVLVLNSASAIGVMIIVGQMILEFGHCVKIYGGI